MELINKNHPELKLIASHSSSPFISFTKDRINISKYAVWMFGIKSGQFAQFIWKKAKLYLVIDNNSNGFQIKNERAKKQLLGIYNRALSLMILRRLGKTAPSRFYLQRTTEKYNGSSVIEVITHKTIKELTA